MLQVMFVMCYTNKSNILSSWRDASLHGAMPQGGKQNVELFVERFLLFSRR